MSGLDAFRQKNPAYKDIDDATLAEALHRKFYSDMPRADFDRRIGFGGGGGSGGFQVNPDGAGPGQSMLGDAEGGETIRARAAGDTRSKMGLADIQRAYQAAQERGGRAEQQAMARAYVQRERQDSPVLMGIGDRVRSVARGVPFIGEYLDEMNAYTANPFDAKSREMALDYENARDSTFDKENPLQSLGARAAGNIAGTIAAMPMATAAGAGSLLGVGAKSVPGAIGRGMFSGAAQGLASGYGREGTAEAALSDAGIGMALGGAAPAVLAAGSAGVNAVKGAIRPPDALSSVPKKAQKFVLDQFTPENVARTRSALDDLGPKGVLADVSQEMRGIAQGASVRPGTRNLVVDPLRARDLGKNARLSKAMNESLGKVIEPSSVLSEIKTGKNSLSPLYDQALARGKAVDTKSLAEALDARIVDARGRVQAALKEAREMLNIPGTNQLDPSPAAAHEVRKALDGMIGSTGRDGDQSVVRALAAFRSQLDDQLAKSVPGIKAVDAQYAQLARQADALDEGARVFRSGPEAIRPADLAARLRGVADSQIGPSAVPLRLAQGARAEIDRVVGSNANDVAAMRSLLKGEGDWNRAKLAMLFGESKAKDALKALDAEGVMENTYQEIVKGSQTGTKKAAQEFIDNLQGGTRLPEGDTVFGMAKSIGRSALNKLTGAKGGEKADEVARAFARLSMAGGDDARAILDAVLARQGRSAARSQAVEAFGRAGAGAARAEDSAQMKALIAGLIAARDASNRYLSGGRQTGTQSGSRQ